MWPAILLTVSSLAFAYADVLHFLPPPPVLIEPPVPAFAGFNYLNGGEDSWPTVDTSTPSPSFPPATNQETTTRFSLPEIIINKSGFVSGGYPSEVPSNHNDDSIVVHNQYLPPTSTSTTSTSTTTTTTQRPLQDEPNYYLPPTTERSPNNGRQLYYYPKPPIQFDEPFVEPAYLPPVTTPPPQYYLPPSPPLNSYLPPSAAQAGGTTGFRTVANRTDNDFFPFSRPNSAPLRLEMTEMKCLSNGEDGYFKTRITVQSFINTLPVFEDVSGCAHRLEIVRNQILIRIPANEFHSCGVTACGQRNEELCTRIRFPQIRGMRTVNDAILALQCKPQERIVSKTHALRMGISSDSQARSAGTLAQGGGDSKFRTQVGIFRRNGDSFGRPLETNGIVQLGEDLMLRTQTKQGDGWNYTKITDISMQRIGSAGEVLNTANLVSNGCVNSAMKGVFSVPPQYEPPLGQRFGFRAVMFQGMKSGDEVVMSIRVMGCINRQDCDQSQCNAIRSGGRIRRDSRRNEEEHVEVTKISFRVADPQEKGREMKEEESRSLIIAWSCIGIALGFLGLIIFILMITFHLRNKIKEEL